MTFFQSTSSLTNSDQLKLIFGLNLAINTWCFRSAEWLLHTISQSSHLYDGAWIFDAVRVDTMLVEVNLVESALSAIWSAIPSATGMADTSDMDNADKSTSAALDDNTSTDSKWPLGVSISASLRKADSPRCVDRATICCELQLS